MKNFRCVLAVLGTCLYPVLFIYCSNAGELRFREAVLPLVLYIVIGMVLMLVSSLISRSMVKGAIASILLSLLIFNFGLLEKVITLPFSGFRYWHVLILCVFLAAFIIWLAECKLSGTLQELFVNCVMIVFGGLICVNFVFALPVIITSAGKSDDEKTVNESITQNQDEEGNPNVYYMIFDEYSNFEVIKKYFGYDNSEFGSFLENLGFTVSYNSSNDSYASSTVMGNYANLEYLVVDTMTEVEKKPYRTKGKLWDMIDSQGYNSMFIGVTSWFGRDSAIDDSITGSDSKAETISGEGFQDLVFGNSIFYPFVVKTDEQTDENAKVVTDTFSYLQTVDFSDMKNQFVQSYLKCPHQPFLFDANGNLNDSINYNNWEDPQYYLNYYIYATNQIKMAVEHLVTTDPGCIIILQSDHSARKLLDSEGNFIIADSDRRRILNAVYYQGEALPEMIDQSGVNTLRLVFGKLFDLDLPFIDVPVNDPSASAMDDDN